MNSQPDPNPRSRTPAKRILVVEDDAAAHELYQILLDMKEVEITEAFTGRKALEIMRTQLPHLIILDLRLPDISGEKVLAEMKMDSRMAAIPVIVVTGHPESNDSVRQRVGEVNFLRKPFESTNLLDRVHTLLDLS